MADNVLEIERSGNAKIEDIAPFVSGQVGLKMLENGKVDNGILAVGQSVGLVRDIPTCHELLDRIMAEAEGILKTKFVQAIA
jgi:nitronate monooxygenase